MTVFFHKITSVVVAGLLLISTFSFTVEKHYCGRFLVDVAVFTPAKDCGMQNNLRTNNAHKITKKMSCCKDEVIVLEGQDELTVSLELLMPDQQVFIASFVHVYMSFYSYTEQKEIVFKEYSPPELTKDIQVLNENFLI